MLNPSDASGPLTSTPNCVPRPVAAMSAVGVARPSAQGQATTRTATHGVIAACGSVPAPSQNPSALTANAGTKATA
ncbi:hypothetical protein BIV23_20540 [Streptomyces monashensis]|uniref:Uncharacterized protein n=1 Tax=Streptomyces monashensis TaxID=1678012 RepID=A0A1S2QDE1_9ACTN|nr:hypothetical protein BIV23_20540 [Streptomyces monashensis]